MYQQIQHAARVLRDGGTVIFPTETVYGLGADARNDAAIHTVFTIKNRPLNHPLIVHIATIQELGDWAVDIPETAVMLAQAFWPGPLTLILPKQPYVSNLVTGGQNRIAVRIPQHPMALKLLEQFGSGIIGTSANKHGDISPTSIEHLQESLRSEVDFILDGGECRVGLESTILDLSTNNPQILRKGAITEEEISKLIGTKLIQAQESTPAQTPSNPVYLVRSADLKPVILESLRLGLNYSFLAFQPCPIQNNSIIWLKATMDPISYGKTLYSSLHRLNGTNRQAIIVELPPAQPAWDTVLDKLMRIGRPKTLPAYTGPDSAL